MINQVGFCIFDERRWILQRFHRDYVPFCYHDHMGPHPKKCARLLNRRCTWQLMAMLVFVKQSSMIGQVGFCIFDEQHLIHQQYHHDYVSFCYHDHMHPRLMRCDRLCHRQYILQQMAMT